MVHVAECASSYVLMRTASACAKSACAALYFPALHRAGHDLSHALFTAAREGLRLPLGHSLAWLGLTCRTRVASLCRSCGGCTSSMRSLNLARRPTRTRWRSRVRATATSTRSRCSSRHSLHTCGRAARARGFDACMLPAAAPRCALCGACCICAGACCTLQQCRRPSGGMLSAACCASSASVCMVRAECWALSVASRLLHVARWVYKLYRSSGSTRAG